MKDSEGQPAVTESPRRFTDRRVCGIPVLWFLLLVTLLLVGAIVGGVLGGVLGTKKKDIGNKAATGGETQGGPITTSSESSTSTSSSTTSSSTTPTPTAVFTPRTDSWYLLKNDVINPSQDLVVELLVDNSTSEPTFYWDVNESRGDPYEHWGFWPAKLNSTYAEDYRELHNISELYLMYNRGRLNIPGAISPSQTTVDDQLNWNWFAPHPIAPYMYLKDAGVGPEFALTAYKDPENNYYYLAWNRTDPDSYPTEATRKQIQDGQAWRPELAFAFLEGELGLWDMPASTATETA